MRDRVRIALTGEDGLRALRVSHAILASQVSGQSVALHHS